MILGELMRCLEGALERRYVNLIHSLTKERNLSPAGNARSGVVAPQPTVEPWNCGCNATDSDAVCPTSHGAAEIFYLIFFFTLKSKEDTKGHN